jgi:hypothetical protein
MRVPTEVDRLRDWIDEVGEPTLEAEAFALQAMLAGVPELSPRRPRPSWRRVPVLIAVALLLLGASVAALAGIGDLFSGPPAPQSVKTALANGSHPPWTSSRIETDKARELIRTHTSKGDLVLWIAPMSDGNVCLALQHPGERRLAPACVQPGQPASRIEYAVDAPFEAPNAAWRSIWGRVPAATERLSLGSSDGTQRRVAISKGFFIAQLGTRSPDLLVARDGSGHLLARQRVSQYGGFDGAHRLAFRPDGTPKIIVPGRQRVLIRQTTWAGDLTLSTGPSVYGGPCQWITIGGVKTSYVGCQGSLVRVDTLQFGLSEAGLHDRPMAVFSAQLPAESFSGVRFRFADGHVLTLRPTDGSILYAFPPWTMLAAHRPLSMDLLNTKGLVARHESYDRSSPGFFTQFLDGSHGPQLRREVIAWSRTHHW